MSDREFENYLTLLTNLLRLDGRQRKQIEKELRAHLEDRLDELASQGVPHDEAVQRALGEFGDAAGLAASFANVSRGRKRRWLMRVTTFSIAATLLIAAGIFTFWPGRNAGPGAAAVVAQAEDPFGNPKAKGKAKGEARPDQAADRFSASSDDASREKPTAFSVLEGKLNQATTLDPVELPLHDLVTHISDMHSFPILLNAKKLEEGGVNLDTPITKRIAGLRLRTALDVILDELDLAYVVHDEYVMITTKEDAQSRLEIRVYDCRDLLASKAARKTRPAAVDAAPADPTAAPAGSDNALGGAAPMPGGAGGYGGEMSGMSGGYGGMGMGHVSEHDQRAQRLINILITNVDDQSWLMGPTAGMGMGTGFGEGGGEEQPKRGRGTISEYDGLIVVTQTAQTHRKIEHVLDMLRRASGLDSSKAVKVAR